MISRIIFYTDGFLVIIHLYSLIYYVLFTNVFWNISKKKLIYYLLFFQYKVNNNQKALRVENYSWKSRLRLVSIYLPEAIPPGKNKMIKQVFLTFTPFLKSPHVRESGFRNPRIFARGIRNPGLWNPESSTKNPESY